MDFSGEWTSRYTYHKSTVGQHDISFTRTKDGRLIGQGEDAAGSELTLDLDYDEQNNVLTGTWYEKTSSSGEYRGSVFHGAVQFILNTELGTAEGKWIGFNNTRSKVNVGDWSLTKK